MGVNKPTFVKNKNIKKKILQINQSFNNKFPNLSSLEHSTKSLSLKASFPCVYSCSPLQINQSFILTKFVNSLMQGGNKLTCYRLIKEAHEKLKYYYNLDFISLLSEALFLLMPSVRLKNYRQGKKIIQKPFVIKKSSTQLCFALKWLKIGCAERTEGTFVDRVIAELLDIVYFNKGKALKLKENVYTITHENRMYMSKR